MTKPPLPYPEDSNDFIPLKHIFITGQSVEPICCFMFHFINYP